MTQIETILKEIESLSDDDKAELVEILLHQSTSEVEADEAAAGQRGLASWTESAPNENWAAFYPMELRGPEEPSA